MKTPEQMAEERNDEKIKAARKYAKQYEGLMYTIGSIAGVSGIQMAFERGVAFGLHQALEITVEREKAERAAEQQWISVEDIYPAPSNNDCDPKLVAVKCIGGYVLKIGDTCGTVAWRNDLGENIEFYDSYLKHQNKVTHWMPLPAPPKEV